MCQSFQCFGSIVPLAMYHDQSWDQIFLRLQLKHFTRQNLFKVFLAHISLENDISTARTLWVIDFTLTFYLEICEIPRFIWDYKVIFLGPNLSRPIRGLFWGPIFLDQYQDFILRPKFFRRIPRLFFRPNIFETDTETFFRDQNFRDRDWYSQKIGKSLDTEKSRDEMQHSEHSFNWQSQQN